MEFGFLTLATMKDYKKAIGMALSLKETNPGVPISIVCNDEVADRIHPYFDHVIKERDDICGFKHKIFLDYYTPYRTTFFIDADMLVFKNLESTLKFWRGCGYTAVGRYTLERFSSFELDRKIVLDKYNKKEFVDISGAGHAYFEKPECHDVFELAREITDNYEEYNKTCIFADEDCIGIAMTMLDKKPMQLTGFVGSPWHAQQGTLNVDVVKKKCTYVDAIHGVTKPYLLHFASKGFPFLYARELSKIFNHHNARIKGVWHDALKDKFTLDVWWTFRVKIKRLLKKITHK